MSFTGSVLTPGCSNTTRVHFACSIFLVGLKTQHFPARDGVGCGSCAWEVRVQPAGACVQDGVCMEGGPCAYEPLECTVRGWAWAGTCTKRSVFQPWDLRREGGGI